MDRKSDFSDCESLQKLTRTFSSSKMETLINRDKTFSANFRPKPLAKGKSLSVDSALLQNKMATRLTTAKSEKMDNSVLKSSQRRMRRLSAIEVPTNRNFGRQELSFATENQNDKKDNVALKNEATGLTRTKRSNSLKVASNAFDKDKTVEQRKPSLVLNSWTEIKDGNMSGMTDNKLLITEERKNVIDNCFKNTRTRQISQNENIQPQSHRKEKATTNGTVGCLNEMEASEKSNEAERKTAVPKLQLEKLDEDNSNNVGDSTTKSRGWSLLKKKINEVREKPKIIDDTTADSSIINKEEESTATYLRMLRDRLRRCQPADIVASSDVNEINKRKQNLERRKSLVGMTGRKSFFETVLTAHALAKQGKVTSRSTESSRKTSRSYPPPSPSSHSLPDISSNKMKFRCSPHFQKTLRLMGKNDFFIKEEETESSQDTLNPLIARFSM